MASINSQIANVHELRIQAADHLVHLNKMIGAGIGFERTRRITGYLVGTLDRFNNAKRAEERDRVKHGGSMV